MITRDALSRDLGSTGLLACPFRLPAETSFLGSTLPAQPPVCTFACKLTALFEVRRRESIRGQN